MPDDRSAIIEKAAKGIAPKAWNFFGQIGDNLAQENRRKASLKHAEAALNDVAPGLLSGTHWLAPMEATDKMLAAFGRACDDNHQVMVRPGWRIMRDAYLSQTATG